MTELLNLLFNPLPNGIMTVLTGMSLLYWVFVLFSGNGIDFGLDADLDVDSEIGDVNDVDAPESGDVSFFSKAMDFINIGKAPFMVIMTLFKFVGWIITIASSIIFQIGKWGAWSVLILIPIFLVTYFLMHWFTKPLVKFYYNLGYTGEESIDFMGRTGKMKSTISEQKYGSAEFYINGDVIRLNVVSQNGDKINYDDTVIIVNETKDKKIFYVKKEYTLNNI